MSSKQKSPQAGDQWTPSTHAPAPAEAESWESEGSPLDSGEWAAEPKGEFGFETQPSLSRLAQSEGAEGDADWAALHLERRLSEGDEELLEALGEEKLNRYSEMVKSMTDYAMSFTADEVRDLLEAEIGRSKAFKAIEEEDRLRQADEFGSEEWFQWCQEMGKRQTPEFQFEMGRILLRRKDVELYDEKAFHWFLKAADQGFPDAEFALGRCYERGIGTEIDKDEALYWYKKALEQGHKLAKKAVARLKSEA